MLHEKLGQDLPGLVDATRYGLMWSNLRKEAVDWIVTPYSQ